MKKIDFNTKIKEKAESLGFDLTAVTSAEPLKEHYRKFFQKWVETKCPPGLSYLKKNIEKRFNPSALLKNARSVIVVGLNYKPETEKPTPENKKAKISDYACYPDYHTFIKKRLFKLAEFIRDNTSINARFKVCVDSAPVAERAIAERAGLGFIGKNQMLINPDFGCSVFLGELITNITLTPDEKKVFPQQCKDCSMCIDNCPTGALQENGGFDAGRCINYLTIEHKGYIPKELASKTGKRIFGCNNCITVCPFYRKSPSCRNTDFNFDTQRRFINPAEILKMNEKQFREKFHNTCIYRTGLQMLKRNAAIALGLDIQDFPQ